MLRRVRIGVGWNSVGVYGAYLEVFFRFVQIGWVLFFSGLIIADMVKSCVHFSLKDEIPQFGLYIRSICYIFLFGYISGPIPRVNARMMGEPCLATSLDFRNPFRDRFLRCRIFDAPSHCRCEIMPGLMAAIEN
jgi:hypothetical protein